MMVTVQGFSTFCRGKKKASLLDKFSINHNSKHQILSHSVIIWSDRWAPLVTFCLVSSLICAEMVENKRTDT